MIETRARSRARSIEGNGIAALIRDWAPFGGVLVAYELMRDLAAKLGVPPHSLFGVERALFGNYEPTLVLQAAIGRLSDSDLIADVASLVYSAHFVLPLVVGSWLWTRDRSEFRRFGFSLVVLCALAFATYVVAPTAPPWLAQPDSVQHLMQETVQRVGLPSALVWLYSHHDYNLYAAFPSLHAGFPVLAAVAAWRRNKAVGVALSIWALVVWVTVVYLGEHYVADVAGGILYAAVALVIVALVSRTATRVDRQTEGFAGAGD